MEKAINVLEVMTGVEYHFDHTMSSFDRIIKICDLWSEKTRLVMVLSFLSFSIR